MQPPGGPGPSHEDEAVEIDDLTGGDDGPRPLSDDEDISDDDDGAAAHMDVEDESIHSFEGHGGEAA